jgi:ABC-type antimicrobial peptide transport system permease subunit
LTGVGLVIGLLVAPAAGGLLDELLVGVSSSDWVELVAAFAVLLVIATLASLGPAWRVRGRPELCAAGGMMAGHRA